MVMSVRYCYCVWAVYREFRDRKCYGHVWKTVFLTAARVALGPHNCQTQGSSRSHVNQDTQRKTLWAFSHEMTTYDDQYRYVSVGNVSSFQSCPIPIRYAYRIFFQKKWIFQNDATNEVQNNLKRFSKKIEVKIPHRPKSYKQSKKHWKWSLI